MLSYCLSTGKKKGGKNKLRKHVFTESFLLMSPTSCGQNPPSAPAPPGSRFFVCCSLCWEARGMTAARALSLSLPLSHAPLTPSLPSVCPNQHILREGVSWLGHPPLPPCFLALTTLCFRSFFPLKAHFCFVSVTKMCLAYSRHPIYKYLSNEWTHYIYRLMDYL